MVVEVDARSARAFTQEQRETGETTALVHGAGPARLPASHTERLSERVIGELFGWELARCISVGEQSPFVIHAQLRAIHEADTRAGARLPLSPSPATDRLLGRLVEIARGEFETGASRRALRSAARRHEIRERVLARIQAEPALLERASALRSYAGLAETAMEHHYSQRLLQELRGLAPAPARPVGERPHAGAWRMQRLVSCLASFPYVTSYVHLLRAELALLRRPVVPLFVRDRELARLDADGRAAAARLRSRAEALLRARRDFPLRLAALERSAFLVAGCGPLPITGLMLHASTGASIELIDVDPESVARANALIGELERLQVLDAGAVRAREADVAELALGAAGSARRHDIVLVASLVPHAAKLRLARSLREPAATWRAPAALLLRSAAGLCAALAYEPVATHEISAPQLPYCGESVPAHQVVDGLDASRAAQRGVVADSSRELLAVAHQSVLNTSELYRSLPESPLSVVPSGIHLAME